MQTRPLQHSTTGFVAGEHFIPLLLSDNTVQIFILQDTSTSSAETDGSSGNEFIDRPIPSKKKMNA